VQRQLERLGADPIGSERIGEVGEEGGVRDDGEPSE